MHRKLINYDIPDAECYERRMGLIDVGHGRGLILNFVAGQQDRERLSLVRQQLGIVILTGLLGWPSIAAKGQGTGRGKGKGKGKGKGSGLKGNVKGKGKAGMRKGRGEGDTGIRGRDRISPDGNGVSGHCVDSGERAWKRRRGFPDAWNPGLGPRSTGPVPSPLSNDVPLGATGQLSALEGRLCVVHPAYSDEEDR